MGIDPGSGAWIQSCPGTEEVICFTISGVKWNSESNAPLWPHWRTTRDVPEVKRAEGKKERKKRFSLEKTLLAKAKEELLVQPLERQSFEVERLNDDLKTIQ